MVHAGHDRDIPARRQAGGGRVVRAAWPRPDPAMERAEGIAGIGAPRIAVVHGRTRARDGVFRRQHMIKAIVFDMDGVLIEAKDWHYEALNRALRLFGMEISRYEHLTTFDGLPTKKKLQMLSAQSNLPVELHDFIN